MTEFGEDMTRALTGIAFPEYWFSRLTHRRCPARWVAVSKDDTGLYAVITADLNILTGVLTLDRAWRAWAQPARSAGMTHPAPAT